MKTSFAKAATLIELVAVLLIIGILAAVSASLMQSRIHEAKWAEGKAIMGTIAVALRAHVAQKGRDFSPVPTLAELGFKQGDLDGTYFTGGESGVGSFSWVINGDDPIQFLITATAPEGVSGPSQITLDQAGTFTEYATVAKDSNPSANGNADNPVAGSAKKDKDPDDEGSEDVTKGSAKGGKSGGGDNTDPNRLKLSGGNGAQQKLK